MKDSNLEVGSEGGALYHRTDPYFQWRECPVFGKGIGMWMWLRVPVVYHVADATIIRSDAFRQPRILKSHGRSSN